MNEQEPDTHGFIIRVWRESREASRVAPEWRGMIEHVEDGRRQYFIELSRIAEFIRPYLVAMGVKQKWRDRVRRWLGV